MFNNILIFSYISIYFYHISIKFNSFPSHFHPFQSISIQFHPFPRSQPISIYLSHIFIHLRLLPSISTTISQNFYIFTPYFHQFPSIFITFPHHLSQNFSYCDYQRFHLRSLKFFWFISTELNFKIQGVISVFFLQSTTQYFYRN